MHDRRVHPRLRITRKVGIYLSSGEIVYAWSFDLSVAGLQIRCEYNADLGTEFNIFIGVSESNGNHVNVDMRVRVIHVTFDGSCGCYRIGMKILSFKRDGQDVYERFVEERLGSPLVAGLI